MPYRDEIFPGAGYFHFTTTDEWERVKYAAMQRARTERAKVAAAIAGWIIRHFRRGGRVAVRFARVAGADLVRRLNATGPVGVER